MDAANVELSKSLLAMAIASSRSFPLTMSLVIIELYCIAGAIHSNMRTFGWNRPGASQRDLPSSLFELFWIPRCFSLLAEPLSKSPLLLQALCLEIYVQGKAFLFSHLSQIP